MSSESAATPDGQPWIEGRAPISWSGETSIGSALAPSVGWWFVGEVHVVDGSDATRIHHASSML